MRIVVNGGEPFAFAGLWETWTSPGREQVVSCTIITTSPNAVMEPIHNRMPVILDQENNDDWLGGGGLELLQPFSADRMIAYEVGTRVNSVRNNDPDCLAPIS